ncbi:hypothetical protein [Mycolicibacterium mageritense]|uniref:hypothetical protein n=1 Tax=Mycolicibacterium mageritense TaxID=53462 RepID=UPI0011DAAA7E|nr:hypothetical protein [Mycolicibacterium mageritense]TXI65656.1 MAG: hypothetical protein E6Q55_01795 [Mycolicibacterium mageritense]
MKHPVLESPRRLAIAAVPIIGFLITPFLPFGPHLWLGVPSVLVWTAMCVVGTVVALRIVEATYQRDGGAALDAADAADGDPR